MRESVGRAGKQASKADLDGDVVRYDGGILEELVMAKKLEMEEDWMTEKNFGG